MRTDSPSGGFLLGAGVWGMRYSGLMDCVSSACLEMLNVLENGINLKFMQI